METLFNKYITEQEGEDIKEIVKLQHKKVPHISGNNLGNEYLQFLLINKSFTSSCSQKQIKLIIKFNHYYNASLKFIKIQGKDNNKVNDIILDSFNWWLTIS